MFYALLHHRARKPIKEAIEEWLIDINNLAYNTQRYYKKAIFNFTIDLPKKYISQITSADLLKHLNKFRWENHKASTTNTQLMALKSFFHYLSDNYGIENIALPIKKYKEELPYQPFINHEQYLKILESTTQRESDIIKMLANTGLRCSELAGLKPENINPNLSSITIQGKGGKVRTIPCNQTVREILSRSINFPKNRKSIYNHCKMAAKRIGLELSPHQLRRFFATELLHNGISLLIISRLLGHSSVRTTELYLHLDSSYLQGVTDVLD